MNLVESVKIFMIIWLVGVFIACLVTSYALIFENGLNSEGGFFMLIPFLMLAIGILMVYFGFKTESRKSVKDLEEILKAKIFEI